MSFKGQCILRKRKGMLHEKLNQIAHERRNIIETIQDFEIRAASIVSDIDLETNEREFLLKYPAVRNKLAEWQTEISRINFELDALVSEENRKESGKLKVTSIMSQYRQKVENVSSVDDEDVKLWTIPCPLQENDILDMRFVSGLSPHDFWLRFSSTKELKKIKSGIQKLFERNMLQPLKSLEMLGGDFCICNGRDYFRGRVIDLCIDSPTSYVILNVDNGGILKVRKGNMYHMTEEVAKIPVQAINCCLEGVLGDRALWDACFVKMFHQIMMNSALVVAICSVPTEICSKFMVQVDVYKEGCTLTKTNLSNWVAYSVLPALLQKRISKSADTLKLLYDSPRSEAELSLKENSITACSSKTQEAQGEENKDARNLYAKDNANGISNSTPQKSYLQEPSSNTALESNSVITVNSRPLHTVLPYDKSNATEQSSSFLSLNSMPEMPNIKEKANVQQEPPSAEQQSSGLLSLKSPLLHSMPPLTDQYVPNVLQYQSPPMLVQMGLSCTVDQPMYANALQIQPPLLQINPFHNSEPSVALLQQDQSQSSQLQINSPVQIESDQNTYQSLPAVTYAKCLHSNVEDTQKGRRHSTCISLKDKEKETILITDTLHSTHHQMETASMIKETPSAEAEALGKDFLVYKQEASPSNVNSNSTARMSKVSLRYPNFKFEVGERYGAFVVHINDPDDFYVHVACKDTAYIETLDQKITENYKTCPIRFRNKEQAKIMLYESWCAVFYEDVYRWYRGKVINWKDDNDIALEVLYVDYGEVREVDLSMIKPLKEEYTKLPICATRCRLTNIQPPRLQENSKHSTWPSETIELFKVLIVRDRLYSIVITNTSNPISVLLVTEDEVVINKTLVEWEYAIPFKPIKCDPSLIESCQTGDRLRDSDKMAGNYPKVDGKENIPPSWNATADDYFAVDIQYHDDKNACYAVSGYIPKDERQICKFYAKNGHCFKGKTCTKEHSMPNTDGWATDQEIVLWNSFSNLVLPPVCTLITVEVTGIYTLNIFYAHIFWEGRTKEEDGETLLTLNKNINSKYNVSKMKRLHITPAVGQLVLAMFKADGNSSFFRARVIDTSIEENMVQVVYVDYGNTEWVSKKDIRDMEPQYLHLPFQALECFISNVRPKTENEQALLDLSDLVLGRQLNGVLISKNILGQAEIELWDGDQKISDKLIEKGYADYKELPSILSEGAPIIPG